MKALTGLAGLSGIVKPADYLNGLVWWVPLGDNADNTTVLSRTGPANGTLSGSTTAAQSVLLSGARALDFEATYYANFGDILNRGTNDFSLSLWFRWDSTGGDVRHALVAKEQASGGAGFRLQLKPTESRLELIAGSDLSSSVERSVRESGTNLSLATWYHGVGTFGNSSGAINLIVNGGLDNGGYINQNGDGDNVSSSGNLYIARATTSSFDWRSPVVLSDVRMYDHVVTEANARRIYEATRHAYPGH